VCRVVYKFITCLNVLSLMRRNSFRPCQLFSGVNFILVTLFRASSARSVARVVRKLACCFAHRKLASLRISRVVAREVRMRHALFACVACVRASSHNIIRVLFAHCRLSIVRSCRTSGRVSHAVRARY
jgi:hypothetical protein